MEHEGEREQQHGREEYGDDGNDGYRQSGYCRPNQCYNLHTIHNID